MGIAPLRRKYLGEILLTDNLINREQLREALTEQQETKERLGAILLKHNFITEDQLLKALSVCYGLPLAKIGEQKPTVEIVRSIPEKMARRYCVLPLEQKDNTLRVAMSDPSNVSAIDDIEKETGLKLSVVLASEKEIKEALEQFYAGGAMLELGAEEANSPGDGPVAFDEVLGSSDDEANAAPVIKYVNSLLHEAVSNRASDIHIEPEEKGVSLRLRIDGSLKKIASPPQKYFMAIVSRIKIIANLDISERRLPQDGKCKLKVGEKRIDVRVSTMPTVYGEKVVMRILDRSNIALSLEQIGFSEANLARFKDSLLKPYGMILCTGPTGSGKTTTLYTGLNFINTPDVNIITVEDPVEYELKSINQVNVKPQIGLTFANVLRAVLRQDPDIVMIGEIRDKETAEIAIEAALTGHLVLSTLHTNDAVSTLSRLEYMGIEPFLIADALDLVIAQRLVRRICPHCKKEYDAPGAVRTKLGLGPDDKVYAGAGCDKCFGSGYRGRVGIHEMLKLSDPVKEMVIEHKGDLAIRGQGVKEGMTNLRESALEKLKAGMTTVEEVFSMTL